MTPRARRLAGALVAVFAVLFATRWIVAFVAERWWAATISPAAARFTSHWALLGFALDIGAIGVAALWFVLQALLVARAIASVQVTRRVGNLQLRQVVPLRLLLIGAVASGVLLGLIAGSGAHAWRDVLALAHHGVTFGVSDPVLGRDLGEYVATLPAWDLVHRFATLLAVLGLTFAAVLYAGIGAFRREHRTIAIHPDARRHLGLLLAVMALVIAAGYWLSPMHLVAALAPTRSDASIALEIRGAEVLAGIAMATGILSLLWTLRGRNAVLVGGWSALAMAALAQRFVLPAFAGESSSPSARTSLAQQFDTLAWGLHFDGAAERRDSLPAVTALWDEPMLARLASRAGRLADGATPVALATGDTVTPVWLAASTALGQPDSLDVVAVVDGATSALGDDSLLGPAAGGARKVWRSVAAPRSTPSAAAWRGVATGVSAGSILRWIVLAWALQQPGLLRPQSAPAIDWHLAPDARAAAILPMFTWLPPDLASVDGELVWVVQGMVIDDAFPLATRERWRGMVVAGARPGVIAVIDIATGGTHFYLDPAAGPTGRAWAAVAGGLVAESNAIPLPVRDALRYPPDWLGAQAAVLGGPTWRGSAPGLVAATGVVPVWLAPATPASQVALEETTRGAVLEVVTGARREGSPLLRVEAIGDDVATAPTRIDLHRLWSRSPTVIHLADSVAAEGDSVIWRGTRWIPGRTGFMAWQPLFAVPRQSRPVLLWTGTANVDRVAGGRTPAEAWRAVTASAADSAAPAPSDAATLQQARLWLERADSAFRRGDLTAFGRAFEQLRGTLRRRP